MLKIDLKSGNMFNQVGIKYKAYLMFEILVSKKFIELGTDSRCYFDWILFGGRHMFCLYNLQRI